jgi:hypothetical protein
MAPEEETGPTCWEALEVVDPAPLIDEQKAWLTNYVTQLNNALHAEPIGDYGQFIDVASFVDFFLINEFTKNGDAYVRSVYLHKDRDAKIVAGPLWDYNLTMAAGGSLFCNDNPTGWAYDFRIGSNDWFQTLASDPAFMSLVAERWRELRGGAMAQAQLEALVEQLAAPLRNASVRDFERWPVCDVATGLFAVPEGETWDEQLQVLRDFMLARGDWMDTQLLGGAPSEPVPAATESTP